MPMFSITLEIIISIYTAWSQQMPMFSINLEIVKRINTAWSQQMAMFSITLEMVVHVYTAWSQQMPVSSPSPWKWSYMSTHCLVTTNACMLSTTLKMVVHVYTTWSQQMPMFSITLEMVAVHVYTVPGHNKCLYVIHHPENGCTCLHYLVTTNAYVLHHPGNGRRTCLHTAWSQQMPVCYPSPWKWSYMSTLLGHNKCLYVLHHHR